MFVRLLYWNIWREHKRGLGSTVAGIILLAVVISYYLFVPQEQERIYREILEVIATMGESAENEELLREMADRAHTAALWTVRHRRGSIRWNRRNQERYTEAFFKEMVDDARYRDREDIEGSLYRLQQDFRRRKRQEKDP